MNDIIEELMDLDMGPKPGSLLYVQSRKWFDTSGGRQRNKLRVAVRDLLGIGSEGIDRAFREMRER